MNTVYIQTHKMDPKEQQRIEALMREGRICSFCAKHASEVDRILRGPDVCICSECIDLSVELLADTEPLPEQLTPQQRRDLQRLHERSKFKHPDLLAYLAIMGGVGTLVLLLWLWHVGVL